MNRLRSIEARQILNSHVQFTNEFTIQLEDGRKGSGSSPLGETISIYESVDRTGCVEPASIVDEINTCESIVSQSEFDRLLESKTKSWGRNNCYALSLALFNALEGNQIQNREAPTKSFNFPRLCLNILNGGKHAYTNPVLSDFHEYLLVPKKASLRKNLEDHALIQSAVWSGLRSKERVSVEGNIVHRFVTKDNRECIEFLLGILTNLNLQDQYDLMIDASGGDLLEDNAYKFKITDHSIKTRDRLLAYWLDLIDQYNVKFLEDPFHEKDFGNWHDLTSQQSNCRIIGDNLYSSNAERLLSGAQRGYSHGLVLKPDQAGTISSTIATVKTARSTNQIIIASHRSISTESTFLSRLICEYGIEYFKIGPLFSDYSSIIRFNELIRLGCTNE
ncbi:MAG: hypothetical protein TUN42_03645 [Dehalogenimonas sp.]